MNLLFICVGGACGGMCRYLLGLFLNKRFSQLQFPIAILLINWLGSFSLGYIYQLFHGSILLEAVYSEGDMFPILSFGFFGAFTTFSTFSYEAIELFQEKRWLSFSAYIGLTVFGSIALFIIGFKGFI